MRAALFLILAASTLSACGARGGLDEPPPFGDAGPPGPPPLEVDCGRAVQFTSPRQSLPIEATITAMSDVVSQGWTVHAAPEGAVTSIEPSDAAMASFTQDRLGNYILLFEAEDENGYQARCAVTVESIVGPPRALCPEEPLRTNADVPVQVVGDGFDDVGVVRWQWEFVSGPETPQLAPLDAPVTTFQAFTSGRYLLRLNVFDADGARHHCEVEVFVGGAPEVFCPDTVEAPTRQATRIQVETQDDVPGGGTGVFELLSVPPRSALTPGPITPVERDGDNFSIEFTPDRQGEYRIRFTRTDDDGLEASCEFLVIGTPTPPTAICPEEVRVRPLDTAEVVGRAEDDGDIVQTTWALVGAAPGSSARPPSPGNNLRTNFTPDIAGTYRLELTVRDNDGEQDSCVTTVLAEATEGLRIEMFWDTDGTDMDLHLLNPVARRWFGRSEGNDCYYANCQGGLSWGGPGSDDDPSLDIDDTDGFGPENINVGEPAPGTYRVGVDAFRGRAGALTVRIYCGGSTTEPAETFGPIRIQDSQFWRVADVEITSAGGCNITDLASGGRPNLSADSDAENRR